MSKLILLVGPIASGKSTYARNLMYGTLNTPAEDNIIIVDDDAIVNCVHNQDYRKYDKKLKPLYKQIENTILLMGLAAGKTVIVDRHNSSAMSRMRFIGLARSLDCIVKAVVFPRHDPETHARRRYQTDPRGKSFEHWLGAAKRHEEDYDTIDMICEGIGEIERL